MKCSGTLTVFHDADQGILRWTWTRIDAPDHRSVPKSLTSRDLHEEIRKFHERWKAVNQEIQLNHWGKARELLEEARKHLTAYLVPDNFRIAELAATGSLIQVVVEPDILPLECLDAGGMPLAVRYRLSHNKKNSSPPTDGLFENRPRAFSAIILNP